MLTTFFRLKFLFIYVQIAQFPTGCTLYILGTLSTSLAQTRACTETLISMVPSSETCTQCIEIRGYKTVFRVVRDKIALLLYVGQNEEKQSDEEKRVLAGRF